MKIEGIDFSAPLVTAIRDRSLVVFAGAGVSMGEPAGLPSFVKLANRIAEHTGQRIRNHEPIDAFLGRLERGGHGVDVHARAVRALAREDKKKPEPTDLHRGLLRLYQRPEQVRLVTTNFDELFEEAAPCVFKGLPEVFRAPALPLGSDFSGVVHLHGSVREPKRMVLTDRDFGRAYLTKGWARRFVVDLFQARTVLFVGYRHEDVVVSYLARALPPAAEPQRFALVGSLTDEHDLSRWKNLGVEPVRYPQTAKGDHATLPTAVRALAAHVQRGVLEWRRTIRDIVASPPPVDQESNDLIAFALEEPENVRFFTESAEHPDWIGWLEQHGFLDGLFDRSKYDDRANGLGNWLLRRFGVDHAATLFSLIAGHGDRLVPGVWRSAYFELIRNDKVKMSNETLSQWVSLLLECPPQDDAVNAHLVSIAGRCSAEGLPHDVLRVFETFLAPLLCSLEAVRRRNVVGSTVNDQHSFERMWTGSIEPHLSDLAERLLACSTALLERRQDLLEVWHPDKGGADPELTFRAAIEPHERDPFERRGPVDMAVDAARDALDWLGEHQDGVVMLWCGRLIRSRSTALRRLAVHGVLAEQGLTSGERVGWLLDNTDLHEPGLRHEIFRVAKASYAGGSEEQRLHFVQRVLELEHPAGGDMSPDFAAHVKLTWLVWLEEAAPDCPHVQRAISDIRSRFPQVEPREHPDLGWSIGPLEMCRVERVSPWSAEEMLTWDPEDFVVRVPAALPDDDRGPDGRFVDSAGGLADEVEKCVERDLEWGIGVASALLANGRQDDQLWPTLLRALGTAQGAQLDAVVSLFEQPELQTKYSTEIARVLRSLVSERESASVRVALPRLLDVGEGLWATARSVLQVPVDRQRPNGWMERAIQAAAEPLAMFWIHSLEALRREGKSVVPNQDYLRVLEGLSAIAEDESEFGAASVSILASQLRFLLAVEERWVRDKLLPLFSAQEASDRPMQHEAVWDGFLLAGQLDVDTADALRRDFLDVVRSARGFGDWKRRQLVQQAAVMAIYFSDDPLREWIPLLLENRPDSDRQHFAWVIERYLERADADTLREWWCRWLKRYWKNRVEGVPLSLDSAETAAMFRWLSKLSTVFAEAVEVAVQMPASASPLGGIDLDEIRSACPVSKHAEALAKLALRLGESDLYLLDEKEMPALIEELLGADLPAATKSRLREMAVRCGFAT